MKPSLQHALLALALFLATMALYYPALKCDFVDYDDPLYVTGNAWVRRGLTLEGVLCSFREPVAGIWHPLTMWSHMLDVELFGLNPAGHHLQSLLWHAANTALLFLLLSRVAGGVWPAFAVAALWAAHPLNADSAVWIAERKNLVSTFFWLATIGLYIRFTRRPSPNAMMPVLAGFALALMAKPMPVTLPFTLLLLDVWPLRRVDGFGRISWRAWKDLLAEKAPLFILVAVFILSALKTQVMAGATEMAAPLPLGARLAYLPVFYVDYLRLVFRPRGLCVLYPAPTVPPTAGPVLGALLILGAISAWAVRQRHRRPWLLVGWLWFLGTLVPVIGLVSLGLHRIADRYMYVPMLGLLLMGVWTLFDAARGRRRPAAFAAAAAAVLALGLVTRLILPHWKDSEALFRRALDVTENNYTMHYNLGRQLLFRKRFDDALARFREAIRLRPDYYIAHNNLGWTLILKGDPAAAMPHLEEALRLAPHDPQVRKNLAMALEQLGRAAE
ncbi:MAG: tetratricopeptide repeat protein [Kiritimatiellae bacterium]|nr:tetratricopeptide repeat protein [Kiritimatiellia bacterium]